MKERFLFTYKKDKTKKKAAVIFPNSYSIGMSNLGFQWIFHLLSSNSEIHCERAFLDDEGKTIESGRRLNAFDILFFTISFEADLVNLIQLLEASRIEVDRLKRNGPLVVIGGVATSILPAYLKQIADVVVSGEAALTMPPLIEALLNSTDKTGFLELLKEKEGIYLPEDIQSNTLCYSASKEKSSPVYSVVLSDSTEFADRGLIEVSRSCLYRCAFCLVTNVYGEYMFYSEEEILKTAERYVGLTDKIGLVAATLTNHPDFKSIVRRLNTMGFQVSFSAFRIEGLDLEMMELIISNENKTMVIAPETASDKLKRVVQKLIPNERIISAVRDACRIGIKRLKLYFIIGLPGEEEEDLDAIVQLVTDIRNVSKEFGQTHGYLPEIIVDINPLVPKPLTPFEGVKMAPVKDLKKRLIYLKNKLRVLGRTFVTGESPNSACQQYLIANHLISLEEIKGGM